METARGRFFRVLGPLQVRVEDSEVEISAGKHRALLATLLLRPNQVVPVDDLIAGIWGDAPPGHARATIQTYVRRLRTVLGNDLIRTRADGYLVDIGAEELDLSLFDRLLLLAEQASDPAQEAGLLADALAQWRGSALASVPSEVLHREAVPVLTERRLSALHRRIQLDLELGRHADVVAELYALTAEHPLREGFWAQLIAALAGSGRTGEALQAYQEVRARLAEDLGIDPGHDLQQLHLRVLRGDSGTTLPSVPQQTPIEDDQTGADQTGADQTREAFVPGQLPPDVAAFTGRSRHLLELDELLERSGEGHSTAVVISAIEGAAGIGKTALAVHWAHKVRDQFPDGQLYANLQGYAAHAPLLPIEVLARFLRALGVAPKEVPVDVDEATALYRSRLADKRILVLLDNAGSPEQVRPLLPAGHGCFVIVTSRDRLSGLVAREGAYRLILDVLAPDEAHALLARVLGTDRVSGEPQAARDLAELCGHLPLALRIAAANLSDRPRWTIRGYATRLLDGNRLVALQVGGDQDNGVRAAFDLSYQAIPRAARRMFRLLGLHPGPDITCEAAAALADTTSDEAELLLETIARAHLISVRAPGRYALHDLLRLYAAERAADEEAATSRRDAVHRLYDQYLIAIETAAGLLYPQVLRVSATRVEPTNLAIDSQARAWAWLDAERANLVATILHTAVDGPRPMAWQLADALRGYFHLRALPVEWQVAATAALSAAEQEADPRAEAAAHLSLAGLRWSQGQHEASIEHAERALALARLAGWVGGQFTVLGNLAIVLLQTGHLARAEACLDAALGLEDQVGAREGGANFLNNLGMIHLWLGRLDDARRYAHRAQTMMLQLGSHAGEAANCATLGEIYHASGRMDVALGHLMRSVSLFRAIGDRAGEADSLRLLAMVHRDAGRLDRALDIAHKALRLARDSGSRRVEANALIALGGVHDLGGDPATAREDFEAALLLAQGLGDRLSEAEALVGLADVFRQMASPEQARAAARDALAIARRCGYRLVAARATGASGGADHEHGDKLAAQVW